jgi:hypothetical protein
VAAGRSCPGADRPSDRSPIARPEEGTHGELLKIETFSRTSFVKGGGALIAVCR